MLKRISKCYSNSSLKSPDSHYNVFYSQVCFIAFTSVVLLFFLISQVFSLNFTYVFCVLLIITHQFAQSRRALHFQVDSADSSWENAL